MDGDDRNAALRLLANAESDGVEIISYFERSSDLDSSNLRTLVRNTDTIDGVERTDGGLTVETEAHNIDIDTAFKQDSEQYLRDEGGVGNRDLADLSNQERGDIVEDEIAPMLMEERGYETVAGFDKEASNEIGIDCIARDPETDQYVLVEAKFTSQFDGRNIGSEILDEGYGFKQISDRWMDEAILEVRQRGILESELAERLLNANEDEIRKAMVVVRNGPKSSNTIRPRLNTEKYNIDHVDIIHIGKVVE